MSFRTLVVATAVKRAMRPKKSQTDCLWILLPYRRGFCCARCNVKQLFLGRHSCVLGGPFESPCASFSPLTRDPRFRSPYVLACVILLIYNAWGFCACLHSSLMGVCLCHYFPIGSRRGLCSGPCSGFPREVLGCLGFLNFP